MNHGNQYVSRKHDLLQTLHCARFELNSGRLYWARVFLQEWRKAYAKAPASTRRRWKCSR